MRGGARSGLTPYMPPREKLATTFSRSNSEALVSHVVLSYPHATFYPCTCGLYRGAAVVAAVLISYDDVKVVAETTTRRRRS
jgi:hypothetical protein